MAATDYASLTAALVATIHDAPGILAWRDAGTPLHVSAAVTAPTMEQCPAVRVLPQSAEKVPTRMGVTNPSNETVTYVVTCWAFSAEDSADAARQRDEMLTKVLDALERDRQLANTVCSLEVGGIAFRPIQVSDMLFATADITVRLKRQS